jgi:hypothetical protein
MDYVRDCRTRLPVSHLSVDELAIVARESFYSAKRRSDAAEEYQRRVGHSPEFSINHV